METPQLLSPEPWIRKWRQLSRTEQLYGNGYATAPQQTTSFIDTMLAHAVYGQLSHFLNR